MTKIESTRYDTALTPAQVNSWPEPTPNTSVSGDEQPKAATKSEVNRQLLDLAKERFKICVDAESRRRAEAITDFEFYAGFQWDPGVRARRENPGNPRPCLTINRMPGFVDHVVNNMRQSRPAIKVDPVSDGADEEQAQIRQGLLRHIEVNSQADIAYDTGFENMCIGGLGWMRIVSDWASPVSNDQELYIRWVSNPFTIYSDPNVQLPDWSDMKHAFVIADLTPQEFKAQFGPETETATLANFESIGDQQKDWFPGGKIRIAEYFHIEYRKDVLYTLTDGKMVLLSELEEGPLDDEIEDERMCNVPEVHWDLINGIEVLKHRIWPGFDIPLIPVIGNVTELNGEKIISGMIRPAREPQRAYNFAYSNFMELMGLAPRSTWIAVAAQIDAYREQYERSNTDPQAVLPYDPVVDESGRQYPPPQRISPSPDLTACLQTIQTCDQQMKAVFSIYDASLGQKGPQESGLAINARKIESDTGVYKWGDNFIRALRRIGIVLNDLLKYYYNTPGKIMNILRDDGSRMRTVFNQEHVNPKTNRPITYDLSKGEFAVVISTGPSAETKRQESRDGMIEFVTKLDPQAMQVVAPHIVEEMDWPGKDKIAAALKKVLPPNLQDPDPDAPARSPQDQKTMDDMNAMILQLTTAVHALSDKAIIQERKEQWETFRGDMDNQVKLAVADIAAKNEQAMYLNDKIFERLERTLARLEDNNVPTAPGTTPPGVAQPPAPAQGAPGAPQPTLAAGPATGPGQVSGGGQ
jgi:Phage P22-like portal protein